MKRTILHSVILSVFVMTSISLSAQKFFPSLDTYIQQNVATTKQDSVDGASFKIECRMSAAVSRVAFVEFNIGSYNKVANKAIVNLYCYETANLGETEDVEMYELTTGNLTGNATYENFNAAYTTGPVLSKVSVLNATDPLAAAWYKFDITNLVNKVAATSGTNKKVRVCLKAVTGLLAVRFYSVNVKTSLDWNFVADFAPFLDVQSPAGINDIATNQVASVYKNANNQIAIDCKGSLAGDASVTVYNVTGQELTTLKMANAKTVINKAFGTGIYLVKVTNGGVSAIQKVILN